MRFEEIYKKETGKDALGLDQNGLEVYYNNYLKWLKKQLTLTEVVGRSEQLRFASCGDQRCKCLKKDDCILIGYKP